MTIGELAKASGVSARSIRHYESSGLISSKRQANGYRAFGGDQVETVKQIGLLLQLGFPIKAIRDLAPCFPESAEAIAVCPKIRAALVKHQSKLKSRHTELSGLLRRIAAIISISPGEGLS